MGNGKRIVEQPFNLFSTSFYFKFSTSIKIKGNGSLAQRQSTRLLIDWFWVSYPGDPLKFD